MKRVVVVGATVIGLMMGIAAGASADDRGNHGPIWTVEYEGEPVHTCPPFSEDGEPIETGYVWGQCVTSATAPEYVNPQLGGGPGISPGVHLLKGNGPEN